MAKAYATRSGLEKSGRSKSDTDAGLFGDEDQEEQCRECSVKLRESDIALQCDFCDNMYCYKCTRLTSKSYDALCKSSQEEGISWFCLHCRINFHGVTKIIKKMNKLEQTQKDIAART